MTSYDKLFALDNEHLLLFYAYGKKETNIMKVYVFKGRELITVANFRIFLTGEVA